MRRNPRDQSVQRSGVEQQPEVLLRPPSRKWYIQIFEFLWNPADHTCCTRTPLNWLSISIYYAFFLSTVIGIMFLTLYIVTILASQDPGRPRYTLSNSPIGSTPGVNFFPALMITSPMIWLSKTISNEKYVKDIENNLGSRTKCTESKSCPSDGDLKECSISPYGYDSTTPCIYLRINRLLDWKPEAYSSSDNLPESIPDDLKEVVAESSKQKIWVGCQGTDPKDRDNFSNDTIIFQTDKGFDVGRFPYVKQKTAYLDPIVAFKINKSTSVGILFSLSCSFWGKNIQDQLDILLYFE